MAGLREAAGSRAIIDSLLDNRHSTHPESRAVQTRNAVRSSMASVFASAVALMFTPAALRLRFVQARTVRRFSLRPGLRRAAVGSGRVPSVAVETPVVPVVP
ncbi:hypothetical protein C211_07527, partial [Stutzerimonas degradans]